MRFTKMHGAGNDFIIIDLIEQLRTAAGLPDLARQLCDRRRSVGADGMMAVAPAKNGGDYAMLFFNSDGSLGEMCGNGARCIARYGVEKGYAPDGRPRIETTAGLVTAERITDTLYRIRLNDPTVLVPHMSVEAEGAEYDCAYVELGDPGIPHAVLMCEELDFDALDALRPLGAALRNAPVFPKGANVSFVKPLEDGSFMAVTFERGVEDFTLACGTGCGSIASALTARGLIDGNYVPIQMPGGKLFVSLSYEADAVRDVYLTGPTCHVYDGKLVEFES